MLATQRSSMRGAYSAQRCIVPRHCYHFPRQAIEGQYFATFCTIVHCGHSLYCIALKTTLYVPANLLDDRQLVQVEGWGTPCIVRHLHDMLSILLNVLTHIWQIQQLLH